LKYKALFLDFYGTLVHEDDAAIATITRKISYCLPSSNTQKEVASYLWSEFRQLSKNSFGGNFRTQREIEIISIQKTLICFQCKNLDLDIDELLFSYWVKPEIFEDTLPFLEENALPVCIVSNIDRKDILKAMDFHGMAFENIITSEEARSYKPRPEIFQTALEKMNLSNQEVLHIGDSLAADVFGAQKLGIDSFWLNRKNRNMSNDCPATYSGNTLADVLKILL